MSEYSLPTVRKTPNGTYLGENLKKGDRINDPLCGPGTLIEAPTRMIKSLNTTVFSPWLTARFDSEPNTETTFKADVLHPDFAPAWAKVLSD